MEKEDYDIKYIKVLDGIRAIAILVVVWFHFWQQSWIVPYIGKISLDFIPRYGFLLVDMLVLLSSFCLFLPYARSMVYKEKLPDTKKFYIHRIARIMPSYYLSMIIALLILLIMGDLKFDSFFIKDTLMHIFFIQNWSGDTLLFTNYMAVLWTVALEVQFYLIFPFLAKSFVKKPILTYLLMTTIGLIGTYIIQCNITNSNISFYVNHFVTFISVYATGMLGAWFYISYAKNNRHNNSNDLFFTILSIMSIFIYFYFTKTIDLSTIQIWQIENRFLLSLVFMLFIVSTALASKIYQKIYTNKVLKFISNISFNLYIYHHFIAVFLKEHRIPYWEGDTPPNMLNDTKWQWTYFILCVIISFGIAIIMTYGVEKPIGKFIKKKFLKTK